MSELTLREATIDDALAITAVLIAAFEEYRGRLDPPSGAHRESVEKVREKMWSARVVVAQAGDQVVGCVFYELSSQHVYLSRLAVLPRYRRRGAGRALVEYVEGRALALNAPCVRLGVRVALTQNRAYYERMGYSFVQAGAHEGYAEPTYVILEKILPERVNG